MDTAGKSCADGVERIGKITPGRGHIRSGIIDSTGRIPSAHRMLGFENLVMVHAGKIIIALIEFADMVEAEPAIFAGPVATAAAAIDRGRAKLAAFFTSFDCAGSAFAFDAAMKAVRFSFGGWFSQISVGLGFSKPVCPYVLKRR